MSSGLIIWIIVLAAVSLAAAAAFAALAARQAAGRRQTAVKELEAEVPPVLERMLSLFS